MARFIRKGVSKFYFLPTVTGYTVAGTGAPTSTELTAGTDITNSIAGIAGFSLANSAVATPDMASTYEPSIAGTDSSADSSLTFYEDDTTATIETLLPKGTAGYIYIQRKGAGTAKTKSCDLFPIVVAARSPAYSAGNDAAQFTVPFRITSKPSMDTAPPV